MVVIARNMSRWNCFLWLLQVSRLNSLILFLKVICVLEMAPHQFNTFYIFYDEHNTGNLNLV